MIDEDWDRLSQTVARVSEWAIDIDDCAYADFSHVDIGVDQPEDRYRLVVVDGMNLYARPTAPESLWAAQTRVAADIKRAATTTQSSFVVTAPVNRRMDQRTDIRPQLVDIASSAAHAADADVAIAIHRADLFDRASERAGEADLMVLKNRHGPTAVSTVAFQGHYAKFVDMKQ